MEHVSHTRAAGPCLSEHDVAAQKGDVERLSVVLARVIVLVQSSTNKIKDGIFSRLAGHTRKHLHDGAATRMIQQDNRSSVPRVR